MVEEIKEVSEEKKIIAHKHGLCIYLCLPRLNINYFLLVAVLFNTFLMFGSPGWLYSLNKCLFQYSMLEHYLYHLR